MKRARSAFEKLEGLDSPLWGGSPFETRSRDCTPLYITRYTGPRHAAHWTTHEDWELTAVLAGEGRLDTGTTSYRLLPGVLVLVPPGVAHREKSADALDTVWLGCRGARFRALHRQVRHARNLSLAAEIECLWLVAHQVQGGRGPELDARLLLVLTELYRQPDAGGTGGADGVIEQALRFMHAHLAEPLTLARLARQAGCSPGHFSRLFRRHTGLSVIQWLLRTRVQQAAHLLRHSGLSAAEIAPRVGIADPFYFSRLFKRHMGRSPRAYRQAEQGTGP